MIVDGRFCSSLVRKLIVHADPGVRVISEKRAKTDFKCGVAWDGDGVDGYAREVNWVVA